MHRRLPQINPEEAKQRASPLKISSTKSRRIIRFATRPRWIRESRSHIYRVARSSFLEHSTATGEAPFFFLYVATRSSIRNQMRPASGTAIVSIHMRTRAHKSFWQMRGSPVINREGIFNPRNERKKGLGSGQKCTGAEGRSGRKWSFPKWE